MSDLPFSGLPFSGLRPPRAPAELRERVLAACAAEAPAGVPPSLLDRLWWSRRARRAWLLALAALICANLVVLAPRDRGRIRRAPAVVPRQLDLALRWQAPAPGPVWAEHLAGSGGLGSGRD